MTDRFFEPYEMPLSQSDENGEADVWHPQIQRLYDYWNDIRPDGGGLPCRRDLDPTEIAGLLPWMWMVDVARDPVRFKFRLMGTRHVDAMGSDPTGKWIDVAFPGFEQGPGYRDYLFVAEQARPSHRRGLAHYHVAGHKKIERIMLPLRGETDNCDIILALTVYL